MNINKCMLFLSIFLLTSISINALANENEVYQEINLGEVTLVQSVSIEFVSDNTPQTNFIIEVSKDESNWEKVVCDTKASGTNPTFQVYNFRPVIATKIRIKGNRKMTEILPQIKKIKWYSAIYLEAESAVKTTLQKSHWEVQTDSAAYPTAYVVNNNVGISHTPADTTALIFDFTVVADTYEIWGRTITPSKNDDSFWMKLNDGDWQQVKLGTSGDWIWQSFSNSNKVALPAGSHRLYVQVREDGAKLDKLCITSASLPAPIDLTEISSNQAGVYYEAECAIKGTKWKIVSDESASQSAYTESNGLGSFSPTESSALLFEFDIAQAGAYNVWSRIICPNGSSNSFYVKMDDGDWEYWTLSYFNDWQWRIAMDATYNLTAGKHHFYIHYREAGAKIDKIYIAASDACSPEEKGGQSSNCGQGCIPGSLCNDYDNYTDNARYDNNCNCTETLTGSISHTPQVRQFPDPLPPYVHPRLFATTEELPQIKANLLSEGYGTAITPSLRKFVAQQVASSGYLRKFSELDITVDSVSNEDLNYYFNFNEQTSNYLGTMAVFGALFEEGDWPYVEKAKEVAIGVVVNHGILAEFTHTRYMNDDYTDISEEMEQKIKGHWYARDQYHFLRAANWRNGGIGTAVTYDFLYNEMTTEQQDQARRGLVLGTAGWTMYGGRDTNPIGMDGEAVGNWYGYQTNVLTMSAAIYGETGWDKGNWDMGVKVLLNYARVAFNPSGHCIEDGYGPNLGLRAGSRALIALARNGINEFDIRPDEMYNIGVAAAHDLESIPNGLMIGGESGSNTLIQPTFPIVWKHLYPNDPTIDHLYHWRLGDSYRRGVKQQSMIDYAIFGQNYLATPDSSQLELAKFFPHRGKMIVRNDRTNHATQLVFDARPDAMHIGHDKSGRGYFLLNGLGRRWVTHSGFRTTKYSRESSTMHINGKGQPYKSPSVRVASPLIDDGLVVSMAADLEYAYNWSWSNHHAEPPLTDGWEAETVDPRSFYTAISAPSWLRESMWAAPNVGFPANYDFWMRRKANLPVQKAFRSVAYVRTEKPFVIISDDIKKDDDVHHYESYIQLANDLDQMTINGNDAILWSSEDDSKRLLVRILQANDSDNNGVTFNNELYNASRTGANLRRLIIGVNAVDPQLKVMLWPHYASDPLPQTNWNDDWSQLYVDDLQLYVDNSKGYAMFGNCTTILGDMDGDGVCNTEDQCPDFDDALIGSSCDDGDPCTINEYYDTSCNCSGGEFQDTDKDTVCDEQDICPNFDDTLIGTACDDGDASTINDTYKTDCTCEGEKIKLFAKIFLEGYYDSATQQMHSSLKDKDLLPLTQPFNTAPWNYTGTERVAIIPENVTDWILVTSRDKAGNPLSQSVGFISHEGMLTSLDGTSGIELDQIDGNHFSIHHRSHLAVMSSQAYTGQLYDFTTSDKRAQGIQQLKAQGAKYLLYAGDYDCNGIINNSDFNTWKVNGAAIFQYLSIDGDGNGIINNKDYNLWINNRSKVGESVIRY